jgi:hypothetical protein
MPRAQRDGSLGRILGFLDRSRYFFFLTMAYKVNPSITNTNTTRIFSQIAEIIPLTYSNPSTDRHEN